MIHVIPEFDRIGHIPKADELYSVRDVLYIIHSRGGTVQRTALFQEARKLSAIRKLAPWSSPTFDEYLLLMGYLNLVTTDKGYVTLESDTVDFLRKNTWKVQEPLNDSEVLFLRNRLLKYKSLIRFLEIVFCSAKRFENFKKIVEESDAIKERMKVLHKWMDYFKLEDDRDARVLLSWCQQLGIVERDEYSNIYYLVSGENVSYQTFLQSLAKNYRETFDRDLRRAKIPDLRIRTCIDIHISMTTFDRMLLAVELKNPTSITMDRATSARGEVEQFGIKEKGFYYYYIKLEDDLL